MFVSGYVQAGVTYSQAGGGALEKAAEEVFEATYGEGGKP